MEWVVPRNNHTNHSESVVFDAGGLDTEEEWGGARAGCQIRRSVLRKMAQLLATCQDLTKAGLEEGLTYSVP